MSEVQKNNDIWLSLVDPKQLLEEVKRENKEKNGVNPVLFDKLVASLSGRSEETVKNTEEDLKWGLQLAETCRWLDEHDTSRICAILNQHLQLS